MSTNPIRIIKYNHKLMRKFIDVNILIHAYANAEYIFALFVSIDIHATIGHWLSLQPMKIV